MKSKIPFYAFKNFFFLNIRRALFVSPAFLMLAPSFNRIAYMKQSPFLNARNFSLNNVVTIYSKKNDKPMTSALFVGQGYFIASLPSEESLEECYVLMNIGNEKIEIIGEPYNVKGTSLYFFEALTTNDFQGKPLKYSSSSPLKNIGEQYFIIGRSQNDEIMVEEKRIVDYRKGNLVSQSLSNSLIGSTLINQKGEIAGISSDSQEKFLPTTFLQPIIQQFLENGEVKRPFIGLSLKNSSNNDGAFILKVVPGSPAEKANIKMASLIKEINGIPISSAEEFMRILGFQRSGKVECKIISSGNPKTHIISF